MNVLEAIDKLNDLNNKINALDKAIFQLNITKEYPFESRQITAIKEDYVKEAERLKEQLEKTPLINTRGL